MSTHTPGPWAADPVTLMVTSERGLVCVVEDRVHADYDNSAEIEANARLIASAPDLLAICLELDQWERDPDKYGGDLAELAIKARAAIRKATGESA